MKEGWEIKTLGEVCEISRGGSPRPIKDYLTTDEDGLNWIKIGDAEEGSKYITSTKQKIKKEGLNKTRFVKSGDLLLTNSMSFGHPYILKVDGCIHDGWLVIHDKGNFFDKDYLYYLLGSSSMYQQFATLAQGAVVSNLNSDLVRQVKISLPPLSEQQRIVEILDREFERIDKIRRNAETSLQYAKDLMQAKLKEELQQKEGWERKKVKDICENLDRMRKPVTKKDRIAGEYPYYGASGIVDYVADYIFDGDFLLVSEDGANLLARSTPIAFSISGKNWVNNHAHILKFENPETQQFVEYYINSIDISSLVHGAAQPKFTQDSLNNLEIPYPSKEEQHEIVARLDKYSETCRRIEENSKEIIVQCDALKQALLRKAFDGEL